MAFTTVVYVPSATAGSVVETVSSQQSVLSSSASMGQDSSLDTPWIVVIVILVFLTISLCINLYFWRSRRRRSGGDHSLSRRRESMIPLESYEVARPARARVRQSWDQFQQKIDRRSHYR